MNGCWDLRPTKAVLSMWIAMALLGFVLFLGRKRDQNGVPQGTFANIVEALLLFVRDEIAVANIGKEEGPKYTPYLASVFFFVMTVNYLGLIPGFFTATGVLGVTIALSVVTFVMTQLAGLRSAGPVGYVAHLFGDVPVWMKPLMFLVEFLGLFTKPFALLVRLFANMLAGHMVLFFILSLIFVVNIAAAVVSVPLATGLYMLELFVALLQAYIFTLLTALFIGQGVALGHHHHADDHAPH
ncbi:MAG: F0F1 ATP synthase subunit A [Myxococcus sp.]|nr:F0F1 ATP synthase subunit A [Myxococcus sp.]